MLHRDDRITSPETQARSTLLMMRVQKGGGRGDKLTVVTEGANILI
jgi:hypothetical protein